MGYSEFVRGEFPCSEMASEVEVVSRCPVLVDPDVMGDYRIAILSMVDVTSHLRCSALMHLSKM